MITYTPPLHRPRAAFSLIELLVVIAILATLTSLLISGVGLVRQAAKGTVCRSNLRQVGLATFAYANDFQGTLPAVELPSMGSGRLCWAYTLSPYLDQDNLPTVQAASWAKTTWCPIFKRSDEGADWDSGYGMNDRPGHNYTSLRYSVSAPGFTWASPDPNFVFWSLAAVTNASQRILAGDSYMRTDHVLRLLPLSGSLQFSNWDFTGPATPEDRCNGEPYRHRGRSNYVFFDGRVASLDCANAILGLSNPSAMAK